MKLCQGCGTAFESAYWSCPDCTFEPPLSNDIFSFVSSIDSHAVGYNPDYFEYLAELESEHFWFKSRNDLIINGLKRFFPDMRRFMEIGCGTGFVLKGLADQFRNAELTGTEIFREGLEFAKNRVDPVELIQMDARDIPYKDHFDVIGAFDVIEHIEEDELVLKQINNALVKGGGLVVTVPQHMWLWSVQDEQACHVRRYSGNELINKVKSAGFDVVWSTSFVSLLLPIVYLSRLSTNWRNQPNAHSELEINKTLNTMFSFVMSLEKRIIYSGLKFSFGSSRLLFAIKN